MSNLTPRLNLFVRALAVNSLINGGHDFWQRDITATYTGTASGYLSDRFFYNQIGTTIVVDRSRQNSTIPNNRTKYVERLEVTTTDSFSNTNELMTYSQKIEGNFCIDLKNRVAIHRKMVRSNKIGIYTFGVSSGSNTFSKTFEIISANTWQEVKIEVPIDFFGDEDNNTGLECYIFLDGSSDLKTANDNQWNNGDKLGSPANVSFGDTIGNYIEVGEFVFFDKAFGELQDNFQFFRAGRNYSEELQLCQRYFEKSYDISVPVGSSTNEGMLLHSGQGDGNSYWSTSHPFKSEKRSVAFHTMYDAIGNINKMSYVSTQSGTSFVTGNNLTPSSFSLDQYSNTKGINPRIGYTGTWAGFLIHWTADAEL